MVNITVKHDFSYISSGTDNALWGAMVEVNNVTGGFLGYGLVALVFIVLSFTFINKTQDIGKSLVSSLFASNLLALLLYYAGKTTSIVFLPDIFVLGLTVITVLSVGGLYYARTNNT